MSDDTHLDHYREVVTRVAALARNNVDSLDTSVPACPDWTARQTIAHLAGLAQDWVNGRLDDYGSDRWADGQVARFDGHDLDDVLAAWSTAAETFGRLDRSPMGGTPAMWAFGDAVVHEADLRPVLAPGTKVPEAAAALGLKAGIARWRSELGATGVPPLDVVATDMRSWRIGEGEGAAESVETTGYELFRALFGRRSRGQVEAWTWSGDPAVYLDVELPYPFRWPIDDVED